MIKYRRAGACYFKSSLCLALQHHHIATFAALASVFLCRRPWTKKKKWGRRSSGPRALCVNSTAGFIEFSSHIAGSMEARNERNKAIFHCSYSVLRLTPHRRRRCARDALIAGDIEVRTISWPPPGRGCPRAPQQRPADVDDRAINKSHVQDSTNLIPSDKNRLNRRMMFSPFNHADELNLALLS
jgi:hypothetical protein